VLDPNPYTNLVRKVSEEHVNLSVIDGRPIYGNVAYMDAAGIKTEAISDVNAEAKLDPDMLRHIGVLPGHAALDFNGASHRIDGAGELRQHAVAGGLDDSAAIRSDCGIDKGISESLELGECAFFVLAHQTAIAGYIRRQYSRQSPFHAIVGQKKPPE